MTNVRVDVNERRFLSVTLAIAAATETVEVVSRSGGDQDRGRLARAGHQRRRGGGAAARRSPLHRAGPARARHVEQHDDRRDARPRLVRRQRQLPHAEQLRARRLRQQPGHAERAVAVGAGRAAVARRHRRVQGADQQLLGGVRPLRRRRRQRVAQVRDQRAARVGVLLQPRQVAGLDLVAFERDRRRRRKTWSGTRAAARSVGRSSATRSSTSARTKASARTSRTRSSSPCRPRRSARACSIRDPRSAYGTAVRRTTRFRAIDGIRSGPSCSRSFPRQTCRAARRPAAASSRTSACSVRATRSRTRSTSGPITRSRKRVALMVRYSLLQQDVFREAIFEGPATASATRVSSTTATRASA